MAIRVMSTEAIVKSPKSHIKRAGNSPRYKVRTKKKTSDPIMRMIKIGERAASA
jgi:hypothetical protein